MRTAIQRLLRYPPLIVVFAFLVRLGYLAYLWHNWPSPAKPGMPYGYELGQVAASIAAGHGFSSPLRTVVTGPTAWFTPIYPYLVAGIFHIWGIYSRPSRLVIEVMNCAFAALTVIPVYGAANKAFDKRNGMAAAWIWVFLPQAVQFPVTWLWDTSLAALCLALIFWATLELRGRAARQLWIGYGALWAAGVLVNPSLLSLLPFFIAWLAWDLRKKRGPWLKLPAAALFVFAIAMVPWTVRNERILGKPIVLRSNFGLELWLGNNPGVPDDWSPWLHPNDDPAEGHKYKNMGEVAYMAEKEHLALEFMRTHPAMTANFIFHRFVNLWLGTSDNLVDRWQSSSPYDRAFLAVNLGFSLFALLGVLFARRQRLVDAAPYAIVLLIFPVVFYLTHSSLRYRFPMDPVMAILAAHGLLHPVSLLLKNRATQIGPEAAASSLPNA